MDAAMTTVAAGDLDGRDAYRLLTSLVVPRPIAWVATVDAAGARNLAPFSFFNAVAGSPPTVMISVGRRAGQPKDTLANVLATGEFVVNLVDEALAERMNRTSGDYPAGADEFAIAGLTPVPSTEVRPPRIAEAAAALEARLTQVVPVEGSPFTMLLGRVVRFHLRAGLVRPNGLIDAATLRPVARLGGDEYATLGEVFELARPLV